VTNAGAAAKEELAEVVGFKPLFFFFLPTVDSLFL
jgi:hypothetical protein